MAAAYRRRLVLALFALTLRAAPTSAQAPGTLLDARVDSITGNDLGARGLALYPNGGYVAVGAGYAPPGTTSLDSVIVRYNPDGTRDPGFGGFGVGARRDAWSKGNDFLEPTALQADGKIVAAGGINGAVKNTLTDCFAARYLADGIPDPSFGTGGRSVFLASKANDHCYDLALQTDGKIVLVGTGNPARSIGGSSSPNRTIVARLLSNGTLDASFGTGGVASVAVGSGSSGAGGVAIRPDGKIVVGGDAGGSLFVLRMNPNGSLDTGFGVGGIRLASVPGVSATSGVGGCLRLQTDGKIVLGGWRTDVAAASMILVRLNPDGGFDPAFNGSGVQVGAVPSTVYSLALTPSGDILACGSGRVGGVEGMVVARFTASGALDAARFNAAGATPGYVFANFALAGDVPFAIQYRPNDDTILVGGRGSLPDTRPAFAFLRIQN